MGACGLVADQSRAEKAPRPAATQLIVPVAIAAAVSERNADGMAQKLGKKASRPAAAIENRKREGTVPQSALA